MHQFFSFLGMTVYCCPARTWPGPELHWTIKPASAVLTTFLNIFAKSCPFAYYDSIT